MRGYFSLVRRDTWIEWAKTETNARLLDSLHMAFAIAELWHYLIDSFGNYLVLDHVAWSVPYFDIAKLPHERNALQVLQSEPLWASGWSLTLSYAQVQITTSVCPTLVQICVTWGS